MEDPINLQLAFEISSIYSSFLKDYYKSKADHDIYNQKLEEFRSFSPSKTLQEISKHLSTYIKLKNINPSILNEITTYEATISQLKESINFHTDLENQLKQGLEITESKLKTLEKSHLRYEKETKETIESLKADNFTLNDIIQIRDLESLDLNKAIKSDSGVIFNKDLKTHIKFNEKIKFINEINSLKKSIKFDAKLIENLKREIEKLKIKKKQLKMKLKERDEEIKVIKINSEEIYNAAMSGGDFLGKSEPHISYYKARYEDKCLEVTQLEKRLRPLLHYEHHRNINDKFINLLPVYSRHSISPEKLSIAKRIHSKRISTDFSINSTPGLKLHRTSSFHSAVPMTHRS
ncbi:unnamed protein product [Blepharisma stoltei]|uniref:Uncharacterized protein n=1 Tax=Blepharisma stoltei TaxID=1481888 RepID=A0AAU9J002_9CILI|nr:unnamed protein product [Blepharisma stoltei]